MPSHAVHRDPYFLRLSHDEPASTDFAWRLRRTNHA